MRPVHRAGWMSAQSGAPAAKAPWAEWERDKRELGFLRLPYRERGGPSGTPNQPSSQLVIVDFREPSMSFRGSCFNAGRAAGGNGESALRLPTAPPPIQSQLGLKPMKGLLLGDLNRTLRAVVRSTRQYPAYGFYERPYGPISDVRHALESP